MVIQNLIISVEVSEDGIACGECQHRMVLEYSGHIYCSLFGVDAGVLDSDNGLPKRLDVCKESQPERKDFCSETECDEKS